ncbi:MAG: SRPBCC domain-containing protein [Alphaproteobacteria bacterium]|nr:SRPBCC domain-containing protein [Alphaproteobacteria bacterium]
MTGPEATDSASEGTLGLMVRRTIRAEAHRLFAAWTDPQLLQCWWGTREASCAGAEIDLRVDRIANRFSDGALLWILGEFLAVEPPHRLVYTWRLEPGGRPPDRVTVRFVPTGDATEVIIVHERLHDAAVRGRTEEGWDACLDRLAAFVG